MTGHASRALHSLAGVARVFAKVSVRLQGVCEVPRAVSTVALQWPYSGSSALVGARGKADSRNNYVRGDQGGVRVE